MGVVVVEGAGVEGVGGGWERGGRGGVGLRGGLGVWFAGGGCEYGPEDGEVRYDAAYAAFGSRWDVRMILSVYSKQRICLHVADVEICGRPCES